MTTETKIRWTDKFISWHQVTGDMTVFRLKETA